MLLHRNMNCSPVHSLRDEQHRLWLRDPLALHGVENARSAPATPSHLSCANGGSATRCIRQGMGTQMRTNIEIDDRLMRDTLRATGAKTKKEAVEWGLRMLVELHA